MNDTEQEELFPELDMDHDPELMLEGLPDTGEQAELKYFAQTPATYEIEDNTYSDNDA